ncbi:MAG: protease modulator HflC [Clostridia bacterium]|nr:protease modulator HflC [Clostridia bacterium]
MNINQGENRQDAKEAFEQNYNQAKKEIKKNMRFVGLLFIVVIIGILLSNSFYIVKEDEVATVRELGEIKKIVVDSTNIEAKLQNERDPRFKNVVVDTTKGLKFKIPFITTVEKDTSKIITYISNTAKINTQDKIKYEINMYAQWKIIHPGVFRTSLGTVTRANSKIDEITYAVVIEKINSLMSVQFLANKENLESVLAQAKNELNVNLATQGIMLVDIDIYRTILPPSNIESTYKKMVAEREAIAQQIRSEGLEIYQNTVADTDRNVAQIKANAIEESETIRGEADATALEVYASGFTKDPEFYQFWRTMKSYEETFDADTVLYLDKNNAYLNFFSNGQ